MYTMCMTNYSRLLQPCVPCVSGNGKRVGRHSALCGILSGVDGVVSPACGLSRRVQDRRPRALTQLWRWLRIDATDPLSLHTQEATSYLKDDCSHLRHYTRNHRGDRRVHANVVAGPRSNLPSFAAVFNCAALDVPLWFWGDKVAGSRCNPVVDMIFAVTPCFSRILHARPFWQRLLTCTSSG